MSKTSWCSLDVLFQLALFFTQTVSMANAANPNLGMNNVAIVVMRFSDTTTQIDLARIASQAATTRNFFLENSYNQTDLNFSYYGIFDNPTSSNCITSPIRDFAISASDPEINFRNIQRLIIVFPATNCPFSASGTTGQVPTTTLDGIVNISTMFLPYNALASMTHEMGHNFGVGHAKSYTCPFGKNPGNFYPYDCSDVGYGDKFDTMGTNNGHFNAYFKEVIGWLSPSAVIQMTPGEYYLTPTEISGGIKMLKFKPPNRDYTYFLDYRQPIGFDNMPIPYFNGTLLRIFNFTSELTTSLIDTKYSTADNSDAFLKDNVPYIDTVNGYRFSVRNASRLGVNVKLEKIEPQGAHISSLPIAKIILNGISYQNTPDFFMLPIGNYALTLYNSSKSNYTANFSIQQNKTVSFRAILQPLGATLIANSNPPGADLKINNTPYGKTPITVQNIPQGVSYLKFSKAGYIDLNYSIFMWSNSTNTVLVNLTLQASATPSATPSPSASPSPSATPTPSPSQVPSTSPSPTPSTTITLSPTPTSSPSPSPSSAPCIANWSCTNWGNCANGTQTRVCLDLNSCGTNAGKPTTSQTCIMPSPSASPTISPTPSPSINPSNSPSPSINASASPSPSVNATISPSPSTSPCVESWSCTGFNACSGGIQSQLCSDANNCGTIANRPPLSQSCIMPGIGGSSGGNGGGYIGGGLTANPSPSIKPSPLPISSPTINPGLDHASEYIQIRSDVEDKLNQVPIEDATDIRELLTQAEFLQKRGKFEEAKVVLERANKRLDSILITDNANKSQFGWIMSVLLLGIISVAAIYFYLNENRKIKSLDSTTPTDVKPDSSGSRPPMNLP